MISIQCCDLKNWALIEVGNFARRDTKSANMQQYAPLSSLSACVLKLIIVKDGKSPFLGFPRHQSHKN